MNIERKIRGIGLFALLSVLLGIVALCVPTGGAGYVCGPLLILLGIGAGWFWKKGRFGSEDDRRWVEENW